tara:strand:- start:693 stop:998 length:306 start_codon:yes stop_codon:yes gene_type:complete
VQTANDGDDGAVVATISFVASAADELPGTANIFRSTHRVSASGSAAAATRGSADAFAFIAAGVAPSISMIPSTTPGSTAHSANSFMNELPMRLYVYEEEEE